MAMIYLVDSYFNYLRPISPQSKIYTKKRDKQLVELIDVSKLEKLINSVKDLGEFKEALYEYRRNS